MTIPVCEHQFTTLGGKCHRCGCTHREIVFGPDDPTPTLKEIQRAADAILRSRKQLMNAARCKVRLVSISGGYYGTDKGRTVEFRAVSDGSEENKRFFQATPNFECKFSVSEAAAKSLGLDAGKIGSEFYVDFTPGS